MNRYHQAQATIGLVHQQLVRWVRDVLLQASLGPVGVFPKLREDGGTGPHIALIPHELGPWPKLVEPAPDIPLIGTGRKKDPQGVVPSAWMEFGAALTEAIPECFPMTPARGTFPSRAAPLTPLDSLPKPLAAWYAERGEIDGTGTWVVGRNGRPHGRLPSLSWQRPLMLRFTYLVMASGAEIESGGAAESVAPFGLRALGVLSLAMNLERNLKVRIETPGVDPNIASFGHAVADSVQGELSERLHGLSDVIDGGYEMLVSILPSRELDPRESAHMMEALGNSLQPSVPLMVQLAVGQGAELSAGVMPEIPMGRSADGNG